MEIAAKSSSRSEFHASPDAGETDDSDSAVPSRLPTVPPVLQSTVKVENRKQNTVDRNKVNVVI